MAHAREADRGREADRPTQIPGRGWKDVALRVKSQLSEDNVSIIAAGVAFYLLLAIVPALAAIVAIYGLFSDPNEIGRQLDALDTFLPGEARQLIQQQLTRLASSSEGALGVGAAVGLLVSLWSATNGTKAMITALNVAYDERESRGFLRLTLIAMLLTLGVLAFFVVALTLVAGIPAVMNAIGLGGALQWAVNLVRWPVLLALLLFALAVLYRYAPDREKARWSWASPGAIVGAALWLLVSIGFSLYVSFFGSYNATYGSLAAVVVLMMWMYLSVYAVLIGAEINAELERQTRRDTTDGEERPMGRRGAYAADTLGEAQGR